MTKFWKEVRVEHIIYKEYGFLSELEMNESHKKVKTGLCLSFSFLNWAL